MAKTKAKAGSAKVLAEKHDGSKLLLSISSRSSVNWRLEYLRKYFADRKDLDTFETYTNEQMAAYEETEQKVPPCWTWLLTQRSDDKKN